MCVACLVSVSKLSGEVKISYYLSDLCCTCLYTWEVGRTKDKSLIVRFCGGMGKCGGKKEGRERRKMASEIHEQRESESKFLKKYSVRVQIEMVMVR